MSTDKLDMVLEALEKVDVKVTKVLDDHEARIRSTERTILRFKTIGSTITTLAGFAGLDALKHHWPFK